MSDWLKQLQSLNKQCTTCVLVTVAETLGSAPREAGAKLIVTKDRIYGTIGGGNLEFKAIELARKALDKESFQNNIRQQLYHFPLGPSLGQCCGGMVILHLEYLTSPMPDWITDIEYPSLIVSQMIEGLHTSEASSNNNDKLIISENKITGSLSNKTSLRTAIEKSKEWFQNHGYNSNGWVSSVTGKSGNRTILFYQPILKNDFHIVLFGAGHVGKAVVNAMSNLSCQITWVDNRQEQFPESTLNNVKKIIVEDPVGVVDSMPTDSYFLVMTHSHELDLDLSERILMRDDFHYFGLIGSKSKRNRFEKRLQQRGVTKTQLLDLTCPIGVAGILDKHPAAIAIAVTAELLQKREEWLFYRK